MGLTNDAKDVIGLLRGVNLIIVLWNTDELSFPLDSFIQSVLDYRRHELEALLKVICRICQMDNEIAQLRSSIEDLTPDVERNYYIQANLSSLLSLFSGGDTLLSFSYSSRAEFLRETEAIFLSLVSRLIKAVLWVRVAYFDNNEGICLPDLCLDLKLTLSILTKLCPSEANMASPKELLSLVINNWRNAPDVQQGLEFTKNNPKNGLYRIHEELQYCD